ncbi:polysaccharide deacetylase family protein [Hyphomicrobium zavarzinii]|uniref:polysaccharide deacetylase family protein n=1 Tax=Hyphomicrobium zavarzinii TaxID=48292 RepID=UPI00037E3A44|nr:polysaccharide deacetylase family protein [Hyphomicrobium zavarzinii]
MRFTLSTLLILFATAATAGDASKAPPAAGAAAKAAGAAATETSALPDNPAKKSCANADALGVARTVEIDTTGGPGFGLDHYKAYDFLQEKEVVLTFDDGPQVNTTRAILDALDEQCTKAIFFSLGKMAIGLPEIIRDVAHRGHTVGTHTWSHADMRKKSDQDAKDEIEKGISGVRRAVGGPISPFFRFPYLRDSQATLAHLASRNIAVFSTDVDSFDFKRQTPEQLVQAIMKRLDKKGKGILLMHDIQPHTAKAMPSLLAALKAGGYKIVQMKAKDDLKTLAEYDAMIEKDVKGLPAVGAERPMSSVIKTVPTGQ